MKALTVCQPYAWALIHGPKRIENRKRCTWHRGRLAIHAGQSSSWWTLVLADGTPVPPKDQLVWGSIIGHVELVDCLRVTDPRLAPSPFAQGPWCWITRDPVPMIPIPCRGYPWLFDVPDDAVAASVLSRSPCPL